MKSLFLLCVLTIFFSIHTFPQNVTPDLKHADENFYFLTPAGELLPYFRNISSNEALNKFFLKKPQLKKQTGINANSRFEPVKVLVDSTFRRTSIYDSRGNRVSYVYEILQNGTWIIRSKNTYTFDNKNNLISEMVESWADNGKYVAKSTYTYDNNGKILSETRQILQNSIWENAYRKLNTYDNYGNCITTTTGNWENGNWYDYTRNLYTYDKNNNMLTAAWESLKDSTWTIGGRNTFTYDNYGNLVSLLGEEWEETEFVKTYLITCSYDQNDKILVVSNKNWYHEILQGSYEDAYTYDLTGKLLTYSGKQWTGRQWRNTNRKFYSYDNSGALASVISQVWQNGEWENMSKVVYAYDSYGNAIRGEAFMWDNTWLPGDGSFDFSYNNGTDHLTSSGIMVNVEYEPVGSEDPALVQEFNLLQNYPNPFNSSTTIKYSIKKEGSVKITVFDILGSRVAVPVDKYKPAGTYYVNFDGSGLTSGVYFYTLESGGSFTTKKFILMK